MPLHCSAGDTARVIFPDGSIQNFAGTPINITIEDVSIYSQNQLCTAAVRITYLDYYDGYKQKIKTQNYQVRTPITNARVHPTNINLIEIFCKGTEYSSFTTQQWVAFGGAFGALPNQKAELISVSCPSSALLRTDKKISVFASSGNLLFSQIFLNSNYSVSCITPCPPNTLECGDCCLPCDVIYNSISDIRSLLSRIN